MSKNALQVSVLVPSYKSKLYNTLPDFNSLSSVFITSPCKETFLSSTPKFLICTSGSLIVIVVPIIKGELLSSSGNSGTSASVSITEFAIILTSPAYVSNPAFPIIFTAFILFNFSRIPSASSIVEKDLQVIIPVPSYTSIIIIFLPDFVSLESNSAILPSIVTFPEFAFISFIFT